MINFKDQIAAAFRKGVAGELEPRGNQVDAVAAVLMKLSRTIMSMNRGTNTEAPENHMPFLFS